ncbi:hotdog fold thioesterase [Vibrio gallicus]|uniref:hotdog fold thioesterase n=1 Tax=Vibrio gallicus TaxID=190897 RepID=UPI0021C49E52|nr:hotdog fold thioesterase [Vibrio gallicus]
MTIWKRTTTLQKLNASSKDTLIEHLNIKYSDISDNSLSATMPVTTNTHQPLGMLHGGASVVLAETLGSVAANLCVEEGEFCVGLEVNANHIKAVRDGVVTGVARPIHLGAKTQIWGIDIFNQQQQLICASRLTVMVRGSKSRVGVL